MDVVMNTKKHYHGAVAVGIKKCVGGQHHSKLNLRQAAGNSDYSKQHSRAASAFPGSIKSGVPFEWTHSLLLRKALRPAECACNAGEN